MIYVRRKNNNHKNHIAPDVNSPALCGEVREWGAIWHARHEVDDLNGVDDLNCCKECHKLYKFINAL